MGIMARIGELLLDLRDCMAFFGEMFSLFPLAVQLVIYLSFSGLVLLGIMRMVLKGG